MEGNQKFMTKPLQGKIYSIQVLRAIAAMLVVLFHAHQAVTRRFSEDTSFIESYIFAFGAVGVHIFFVISGFIMVYTTASSGAFQISKFFRKRVQRIFPIYWICAALYVIARWYLGEPWQLSSIELIGALLLLPGDAAAIIGPAWTLAFELFFYACFGIAMIAGPTRGLILLTGWYLLFISLGILFPFESSVWKLATNTLLLEFLAGSAIGWCLVKGVLPQRGGLLLVFGAIIIFVIGICWGYDRLPSVLIWGVPSTFLVAGFVVFENTRGATSAMRRLAYFGESSYALYLIHILVIMLFVALAEMNPFLGGVEPAVAVIPIALASLAVAEVLHHHVERPILRRHNFQSREALTGSQ